MQRIRVLLLTLMTKRERLLDRLRQEYPDEVAEIRAIGRAIRRRRGSDLPWKAFAVLARDPMQSQPPLSIREGTDLMFYWDSYFTAEGLVASGRRLMGWLLKIGLAVLLGVMIYTWLKRRLGRFTRMPAADRRARPWTRAAAPRACSCPAPPPSRRLPARRRLGRAGRS